LDKGNMMNKKINTSKQDIIILIDDLRRSCKSHNTRQESLNEDEGNR
jgi:hypothetical protein